MKVAILVMAAGFGRRFREQGGGQKLLAEIQGLPMLSHTLRHALATGADVYVVTQPEDRAIHALLNGCQPIYCQSQGLGESISAGVRATADYDGWIIALGDMPWLKTSSYLAVIHALATESIVRPLVNAQAGHPVGFSRIFYLQLVDLHKDEGARSILAAHPATLITLHDPGCLNDIDYPVNLNSGEQNDYA